MIPRQEVGRRAIRSVVVRDELDVSAMSESRHGERPQASFGES